MRVRSLSLLSIGHLICVCITTEMMMIGKICPANFASDLSMVFKWETHLFSLFITPTVEREVLVGIKLASQGI